MRERFNRLFSSAWLANILPQNDQVSEDMVDWQVSENILTQVIENILTQGSRDILT